MNFNSSPSPFPIEQIGGSDDSDRPFGSSPYSSSVSCHIFFNSTQDHLGYYHHDHPQLYQPQHISDDNQHGYNHGGSTYHEINDKVDQSGLKLTLWKKKDDNHGHEESTNPMKWMSSKMRLMQKMKKSPRDHLTLKITNTAKNSKLDDQKQRQPSSSLEADNLSSNSSYYTTNAAIRVCSDCNTTKTPLWRSGPKGPKSLCNACGIRQRKARRAMAAAAAAANGTGFATSTQPPAATKIKVQHKEKIGKNRHASVPLKKRFKTAINAATSEEAGSTSNDTQRKIRVEDFLINLSKNLSFHRVFPEDEKDAAILLMALSSGLVHG